MLTATLLLSCPMSAVGQQWKEMDYGPFLTTTIEVDRENIAYKSIAIRLDKGPGGVAAGRAFVAFDTDTLRYAAGWTGSGLIDWRSVVYDGSHATHPSLVGQRLFVNPMGPGWGDPDSGSFADPRLRGEDGRPYGPLSHHWGHWKGLYRHGERIVLAYSIGTTDILDSPGLAAGDGRPRLTRTIELGPRQSDLVLQVAALPGCRGRMESCRATSGRNWPIAVLSHDPSHSGGASQDSEQGHFSGDRHFVVKQANRFDMTNRDFTITAQLRTTQGGTILSQAAQEGPWIPNGKTFFIRDGRLCYDIGWVGAVESAGRVNDGQWHEVAVTYQASPGIVRLYVDGKRQGEKRLRPAADAPGQLVRIGYTASNFPEPQSAFIGDLKEVRFYQWKFDESSWQTPDARQHKGLEGHWQLARLDGNRLPDLSGHGSDGVLNRSGGSAAYAPDWEWPVSVSSDRTGASRPRACCGCELREAPPQFE